MPEAHVLSNEQAGSTPVRGTLSVSRTWPRGGVGRHARFKIECRKAGGFEALRGHYPSRALPSKALNRSQVS